MVSAGLQPPGPAPRHPRPRSWPAWSALLAVTATLGALVGPSQAFYIAFQPTAYKVKEPIKIYYNKLFSERTQLPFAYHELPFVCKPAAGGSSLLLNLGEVFKGDRFVESNFKLNVLEKNACEVLCTVSVNAHEVDSIRELIDDAYRVEWTLDGLPGATPWKEKNDDTKKEYESGFRLGDIVEIGKKKSYHLNTHFTFNILYERTKNEAVEEYYIIGFEVFPRSIKVDKEKCPKLEDPQASLAPLELTSDTTQITYTYAVMWTKETQIHWYNRWDLYLSSNNDVQVHWYSIINSFIILLFLTAMVAIIMLRTLNKDIAMYNDEELKEEAEETYGWKLLHGDVFRAPKCASLLAPLVGSGIQFSLMVVATTIFAMFGILSPSYRGGLVHVAFFVYVFMGLFAGYFSSRLYKAFKGASWAKNAFTTAMLTPTIIVLSVLFLNCFVWSSNSSRAIPFGTFFALAAMWVGISLPLVFIGSYFGWKKQAIEHPVRTNQIPRQIPERIIWYLRPVPSILITGLIPFAVEFLELFFILTSMWRADSFYYMFGFLGLCVFLLVVTCIEITIVTIYFQLSAEDYRWHWRAFMVSSASTFWIFAYAVFFFATMLDIREFTPALYYFVYSFLGCFIYWLCTGMAGFLVTYYFLIQIYGAVKVD